MFITPEQSGKGDNMLQIRKLVVFTGKDACDIDLSVYDKVTDNSIEYDDSIHMIINFYKDDKLVRQMWEPKCDITYETDDKFINKKGE